LKIEKGEKVDLIIVTGIAIGLAMDCFAVAISTGTGTKKISKYTSAIMAFLFGFFQFGMVLAGWFSISFFKKYILNFDHWIAFLLLCFVGIKMLKEGFKKEKDGEEKTDYGSIKWLILLSFATSIDAFRCLCCRGFFFIDKYKNFSTGCYNWFDVVYYDHNWF